MNTMRKTKSKKKSVRVATSRATRNEPRVPRPIVISHETLFPKGSFARAGGALGSIFGPKGMALGSAAGSALSRITGVGDYKVRSNTIMTDTATFSGEVPAFGKTDNSTRVRHREFVSDITAGATPGAFVNTTYIIQPGNAQLFPWLSSLAQSYQQYKLHGMVFVFKSTTSDYSAAGALGKVAMATNYNVRDSAFQNMQELENAEFSVSGKPSFSRVHPIECAPDNGVPLTKWVRDAQYDTTAGGDDRLYDVGKFQLATQGLPSGVANATIGELWVTYDIEFFKPIVARLDTTSQYTPVSVPVFDTYAGTNGVAPTSSLMMMETTKLEKPFNGWATHNTLVQAMRNPGVYNRVNVPGQDTRLSRSTYRESAPDPSTDPTGSYPAYWENARTLVLQRKGVYHLRLAVNQAQNLSTTRLNPSSSQFVFQNSSVVPASATESQRFSFGQIEILGDPAKYGVFHGNVPTNQWLFGNPNDHVSGTGSDTLRRFYPTAMSWNITIWVKENFPGGGGIKLQFLDEIPDGASRDGYSQGLLWASSDDLNENVVPDVQFNIGFVSVSEATYYVPTTQGFTKDDETLLKESLASVEALLPKLRELGFV